MKQQKGFTTIELLVAVSIISILAVVVIADVNSVRARARDASIKANMGHLTTLNTQFVDRENSKTTEPQCIEWDEDGNCIAQGESGGATQFCQEQETQNILTSLLTPNPYEHPALCVTNPEDTAKWTVCAPMNEKANKAYCMDSSGAKTEIGIDYCNEGLTSCDVNEDQAGSGPPE